MVRNDTGTYVVVVGGYYDDYSDVVEIYSIEEGLWTSGEACSILRLTKISTNRYVEVVDRSNNFWFFRFYYRT